MAAFKRVQGLSRLSDRGGDQDHRRYVIAVANNSSSNSTATPLVPFPGDEVKNGDLILVTAVRTSSNGAITTPVGYTQFDSLALSSNRHACIYKVADGTETEVPAVVGSNHIIAYVVRGWVMLRGIAGSSSTLAAAGLSADNAGLTPLPPKYMVFCASGPTPSVSYASEVLGLQRAPGARGFYTPDPRVDADFAVTQQYNAAQSPNTISAVVVEVE